MISVSAGKAKTASRRLMPMRPNLIRWLLPLVRTAGPVCPTRNVYRGPHLRQLRKRMVLGPLLSILLSSNNILLI